MVQIVYKYIGNSVPEIIVLERQMALPVGKKRSQTAARLLLP